MKYKMYKKNELAKNLEMLTGEDFTAAEEQARMDGDKSLDIMTSRRFYAAVAARAYKVPLEDILELNIQEYAAITGDVGGFLIGGGSEEKQEPPNKSGKSA